MQSTRIAPSILTADFSRLGEQVEETLKTGIDWIHIDVMDGRFVPNISIGPVVVKALRPLADRYNASLDVHLMIVEPERYLADFVNAGADSLTVHAEASPHLHRTVQAIHELGARAGVALNPGTPIAALEEVLQDVDLVLVMSVNPGFGGQTFIPHSLDKIRRVRKILDAADSKAELQVDGGVKTGNIHEIAAAGASLLVAGSAIYDPPGSITDHIAALRQAIG